MFGNLLENPELMIRRDEDPGAGAGEGAGEGEQETPKKLELTQDELNQMVGNARKEGRKSAMKKFGVESDEEFDGLVDKWTKQQEEQMTAEEKRKAELDATNKKMAEVEERAKKAEAKLVVSSKVADEYHDDIIDLLSAKGLEINSDNVDEYLKKYPMWAKKVDPLVKKGGNMDDGKGDNKKSKPRRTYF